MATSNKFLLSFFSLWLIGPYILSQPLQNNQPTVSELYQLTIEWSADWGSLSRFYQIEGSPERRERFITFHQSYLDKLSALNIDQLSINGQVDYVLMKRRIEEIMFQLEKEKDIFRNVEEWIIHGVPLYELEKQRRRGATLNAFEVAKELDEIAQAYKQETKKVALDEQKYSNVWIKGAEMVLEGQKQAIQSVYDFYNAYDPDFSWWVKKPYETLNHSIDTFIQGILSSVDSTTFPQDDGSGIVGQPIGEKELIRQLRDELIPYTPDELVEIAQKEFAWCDAELLKASREMGFGEDWKAALEKVKQSYVPVGEQPEAMYQLYKESIAFLKEHDLITIPPIAEESWRMRMLSPAQQLVSPFFLGGETLQISYPTDDMEHKDKLMSMRGNNPHFSRATVHHELIAGHHLQGFMNRRYKTYRREYGRTPFWTEGWALYWEMLLWEKGFPRSAEDRMGMLFWRSHRCARIIFSLNYHLGTWTPQQCIDFLVDRVGHEGANAAAEVRRSFTGNYGPLYQIAYMIGGLQFYRLKEELVDSGQMTYKEFHDAVMKENNMPVELVRAILTKQPLNRDIETSWKFYADLSD